MGIFSVFKAQKAYKLQSKNLTDPEAQRLYEEAISEGLTDMRFLLAYSTLLVRSGQYEKGKEFLIRIQKYQMSPDQKNTLFINYAACCLQLGETEKGIRLLERQHQHNPSGKVYQTLGVLYVEKFAKENEPDFDAIDAENAAAREKAKQEKAAETEEEAPAEEEPLIPAREKWESDREKALAFEKEAVDYDDEDPVCLDNLGQFYYRCLGDRVEARKWFDRAIKEKDTQIDTLWFLSRYDLEAGDTAKAIERLEKAAEGRPSPLNYASRDRIREELARLGANPSQED